MGEEWRNVDADMTEALLQERALRQRVTESVWQYLLRGKDLEEAFHLRKWENHGEPNQAGSTLSAECAELDLPETSWNPLKRDVNCSTVGCR